MTTSHTPPANTATYCDRCVCTWHGLPCRQHNCSTSWTEPGQ